MMESIEASRITIVEVRAPDGTVSETPLVGDERK
jgi:hypothetical protein